MEFSQNTYFERARSNFDITFKAEKVKGNSTSLSVACMWFYFQRCDKRDLKACWAANEAKAEPDNIEQHSTKHNLYILVV